MVSRSRRSPQRAGTTPDARAPRIVAACVPRPVVALVTALIAALIATGLATRPPRAGAEPDSSTSSTPPPPGPVVATAPDGSQAIVTTIAAGSEAVRDVRVRNATTDRLLTIAIAPMVARVEPDGTFTLDANASGPAAWLRPGVPQVRLGPGEEQAVPVEVRVPADAAGPATAAVAFTVIGTQDLSGVAMPDASGEPSYVAFVITVAPADAGATGPGAVPPDEPTGSTDGPRSTSDDGTDPLRWPWYAAAVALILIGVGVRWAARPHRTQH